MLVIEELAEEGSSFYPRIDFYDEDGAAMTPDTLYWSLTDMAGNVINARSAVVVSVPSTYLTLKLSGDDLKVEGDDIASRLITYYGTYTSSTHGSGRPFLFQTKFNIQPRIGE